LRQHADLSPTVVSGQVYPRLARKVEGRARPFQLRRGRAKEPPFRARAADVEAPSRLGLDGDRRLVGRGGGAHRLGQPRGKADRADALADLKREGKIRRVGLCNVSVDQLKAARAIVEIESVQNKYNLNALKSRDVVDYCRDEAIAFLPWGPFDAQGFVQGGPLAEAGSRLAGIAGRLGVAPGQIALAWLLHKGDDIVPIPGTKRRVYLEENVAAAAIRLDADEVLKLDAALASGTVSGNRYADWVMATIDR
jgi:diketogulonate reductase-like aldo/keto reductase